MARAIDYVEIRGQGQINAKWTVVYEDETGQFSTEEFYSVDQESPRFNIGLERLRSSTLMMKINLTLKLLVRQKRVAKRLTAAETNSNTTHLKL